MERFEGFIQYLKTERRYSEHTQKAYLTDLTQFSDFVKESFETDDLSQVSAQMVRSWVMEMMESKKTARSVNRKLSTLKSYYKFLLRDGKITENPMSKVSSPKTESRLPVYMEKTDMDKLFSEEMFDEGFTGLRNKMLIMLFYYTGMRRSELIGLKLSSFDQPNQSLKVLGKGNKERIIPVNKELGDMLSLYISERNKEFGTMGSDDLLLTDNGKVLYPKFVHRVVTGHLSKVSTAEKKSPHVLRHTFATHLLNNGADLNAIKEILGHANLSATQIYTHNSVEKLKQIYNQAHPKA